MEMTQSAIGNFLSPRMLPVPNLLLVLAQLAFQLVHAAVDARVRVAVVMVRDEHVLVLRVHDHFGAHAVFCRVEDHFDFLNPIVVFVQLVGLLLGVGFQGDAHIHVPGRYGCNHSELLHPRRVRRPCYGYRRHCTGKPTGEPRPEKRVNRGVRMRSSHDQPADPSAGAASEGVDSRASAATTSPPCAMRGFAAPDGISTPPLTSMRIASSTVSG